MSSKYDKRNILVIKNGECETDIKNFIRCDRVNLDQITIIHSKHVDDINIVKKYKGIVILGGCKSLVDIDKYPHLQRLVYFIRNWSNMNIPILGICLGCQLIGLAFGHEIRRLPELEMGYFKKIEFNTELKDDFINENIKNHLYFVLSLHNDYIRIKKDSELDILATYTKYYKRRNIQIEMPYIVRYKKTYGFQFHPDITINVLEKFCLNFDYDMSLIEDAVRNEQNIEIASHVIIQEWIDNIVH